MSVLKKSETTLRNKVDKAEEAGEEIFMGRFNTPLEEIYEILDNATDNADDDIDTIVMELVDIETELDIRIDIVNEYMKALKAVKIATNKHICNLEDKIFCNHD